MTYDAERPADWTTSEDPELAFHAVESGQNFQAPRFGSA